jgi:hypothetical protein
MTYLVCTYNLSNLHVRPTPEAMIVPIELARYVVQLVAYVNTPTLYTVFVMTCLMMHKAGIQTSKAKSIGGLLPMANTRVYGSTEGLQITEVSFGLIQHVRPAAF